MTRKQCTKSLSDVKATLIQDEDFLRTMVQALVLETAEGEMDECLGAGRYERTDQRLAYRSGTTRAICRPVWGPWVCACPRTGMGVSRRSCRLVKLRASQRVSCRPAIAPAGARPSTPRSSGSLRSARCRGPRSGAACGQGPGAR